MHVDVLHVPRYNDDWVPNNAHYFGGAPLPPRNCLKPLFRQNCVQHPVDTHEV
jgi:hypothetical protein